MGGSVNVLFKSYVNLCFPAVDLVDIRTINVVFARYGYHSEDNAGIDCSSLQTILVDLYNTNRVQNHSVHVTNLETTAEIMLNWLLNMFDR